MKKYGVGLLILASLTTAIAFATGAAAAQVGMDGGGCGGGVTASITPNLGETYDHLFTEVCTQHDKCWATWGMDKGSCDSVFILNMLAECQHQVPKAEQPACEHAASEYHSAVASGEAAYERVQKEALDSLFNGPYKGLGTVTATVSSSDGSPPVSKTGPVSSPVVTVVGGAIQGGSKLHITGDSATGTATATATVSVVLPGFTPAIDEDLTFTYSMAGVATVKGTIDGHATDAALGATMDETGSFSGTLESSG